MPHDIRVSMRKKTRSVHASLAPTTARIASVVAGVWLLAYHAPAAPAPVVLPIDDFESGNLSAWSSSMSPEYYKGGGKRDALRIIPDPRQGRVLRCDIRFTDPGKSEPVFISRRLQNGPRRLDIVGVRFRALLTGPGIDPRGGFKVRLRTSPRAFTDLDVQEQLGRPFPVNQWVDVRLDATPGPDIRNIWNTILDRVKRLTFRLDDVDTKNATFALLLDDVTLLLRPSADTGTYSPRVSQRPRNAHPRILLLQHRAAGHYGLDAALRTVAPDAKIDRFWYRGRHFEFFGFPAERKSVLRYDAVIMVDVDPIVMSFEQCAWITDAVASGAHLLVFGGPVSITHAKDWKRPLREALPVTFRPDAKDVPVRAPATPGPPHFLNRGIDPAGLGRTTEVLDVTPRPNAIVPWTAGKHPLIVTAPFHKGRSTLVCTWPHVRTSRTGGFFTSPMSDDLMRLLVRYALGRVSPADIAAIDVSSYSVIGSGTVQIRIESDNAPANALRLFLDGQDVPAVRSGRLRTGGRFAEFAIDLHAGLDSEILHDVRAEVYRDAGGGRDFRDFPLAVYSPVDLEVRWKFSRCTFTPGAIVEFEAAADLRGLPRVAPGRTTTVSTPDGGLLLRMPGFADAWVYQPGNDYVIHNQVGSADFRVERSGGLLPVWRMTGQLRCARADGSRKFADDDRILDCTRTIRVLPDAAVEIDTTFRSRVDMRVHRLPVTLVLPATMYAGIGFSVRQDGRQHRGLLPLEPAARRMFDGRGLDLVLRTPAGPLRLQVPDPGIHVWMQDLRRYGISAFRIEIETPWENRNVKKGDTCRIPLRISLPAPGKDGSGGRADFAELIAKFAGGGCAWSARLHDPRSRFTWPVPLLDAEPASARFRGILPNLASGSYRIEVAVSRNDRTLVRTSQPCWVVDPLVRRDFFPVMSIIGIAADGHYLNEAGIEARIRDLLEHGFNTAAITGIGAFLRDRPDNAGRLRAWSESRAQQLGMAVAFEYTSLQRLSRKGKTTPCVFTPEYPAAVERDIRDKIDLARRTPRLLSMKVIDEPWLGIRNMDYCDHCRREFEKRFGMPMPRGIPPEPQIFQRWALARFIGAYGSRAYAVTADIARRHRMSGDLLLTFMSTGLGYQRPLTFQQDAFDWSRFVQRADFDVYPYFYPRSRRIRMLQAGFCMAYMRDIARVRAIPWGFYVELDDRNWPFQKNPEEATAECAFTAVARGADYLNSFIHRVAGTGTQARPRRWERAGQALRWIRRLGPLLAVMPAQRTPLAILYPAVQEAVRNGYQRPEYFMAALTGGFGPVDICLERGALETGRIPYHALLLWDVDFLHADFARLLDRWVREGGVLFCNRLPDRNQRNEPLRWNLDTDGETAENSIDIQHGGRLRYTVRSVGRGRIITLLDDIERQFRELVEHRPLQPDRTGEYRRGLAALFLHFVHPGVRVEYRETDQSVDLIEAGLRATNGAFMVWVVNHQPQARRVKLLLPRTGKPPAYVADGKTGEPVPLLTESGESTVRLTVPGRWARCIVGWTQKPSRLRVKADADSATPGGVIRYEVRISDDTGRPVAGPVPVVCEVRNAKGERISRFGCERAVIGGMLRRRIPVPVNLAPGRYTLTARSALLPSLTARTAFTIIIPASSR